MNPDTFCPYCAINTAGQHQFGCPNYGNVAIRADIGTPTSVGASGWIRVNVQKHDLNRQEARDIIDFAQRQIDFICLCNERAGNVGAKTPETPGEYLWWAIDELQIQAASAASETAPEVMDRIQFIADLVDLVKDLTDLGYKTSAPVMYKDILLGVE